MGHLSIAHVSVTVGPPVRPLPRAFTVVLVIGNAYDSSNDLPAIVGRGCKSYPGSV